MEANDDKRMTIIDANPVREGAYRATSWAILLFGVSVVALIGIGIWTVRGYLIYVGYAALIAAFLVLACGVALPVIFVLRFATRADKHDIGEFGTILQGALGHMASYAPMTTNTVKITQRKGKTTITPIVPSIIELIDTGVIAVGQLSMHMGFEQSKGGLIPVIDAWPGTFAIAGRGRSGKTRRVISIIFQAIIAGARIFICDPHITKPDGLGKILKALSPWLTIVEGDNAIIDTSRLFLGEMERRVDDKAASIHQPWIIIYDEWSRLMTTDKIEDDDREILISVVTECSRQYAGYNGFAGIIGQSWTNEDCGGTTIRRSLHKAFIHQLSSEYAKFFFKGKWPNLAEDLNTRECLYREGSQVKKIVTMAVPDNAAAWFADWLYEHIPSETLPAPATAQPNRQIEPPRQRREAPQRRITEQLAFPNTPSPEKREEIELENIIEGEPMNTVNELHKPGETVECFTEEKNYSPEEELQVILASVEIVQQGKKITRTGIRDHLKWNNKQYSRIIMPVCDKRKIAM